jgi:DNA-binding HxlR family transcriptional regulator
MPRHDDITTARLSGGGALLVRALRRAIDERHAYVSPQSLSEVLRALERAAFVGQARDAGCRS